jgi:hypothetical protein
MVNARNARDAGFGASDASRSLSKVRKLGPLLKSSVGAAVLNKLGSELTKRNPGSAGQPRDDTVISTSTAQSVRAPRENTKGDEIADRIADIGSWIPLIGPAIKFARQATAKEGSKYYMGGGNYAANLVKHGLGAAAETGLSLVGGNLIGKLGGVAGQAANTLGGRLASRVAATGAFSPAVRRLTDIARSGASTAADVASRTMSGGRSGAFSRAPTGSLRDPMSEIALTLG